MYLGTEMWLNANLATINQLPQISELLAEFSEYIRAIRQTRETQETSTKGAAKQKNLHKKNLIGHAEIVLNILKAYSSIHNQVRLHEEVRYSLSQLNTAADTVFVDICRLLHRKATEHFEALQPFLLTQEHLDNLRQATDTYAQSIPTPRLETGGRKIVTGSLSELFSQTDKLLKDKIDKLLALIKPTNPNSYQAYLSARKLVNLGGRKKKESEGGNGWL